MLDGGGGNEPTIQRHHFVSLDGKHVRQRSKHGTTPCSAGTRIGVHFHVQRQLDLPVTTQMHGEHPFVANGFRLRIEIRHFQESDPSCCQLVRLDAGKLDVLCGYLATAQRNTADRPVRLGRNAQLVVPPRDVLDGSLLFALTHGCNRRPRGQSASPSLAVQARMRT